MVYGQRVKTIDVQDLPGPTTKWLDSLESGEEILISHHDKIIARLVAEPGVTAQLSDAPVDWSTSAALTRDRTGERVLTAEEIAAVLEENKGNW